MRTLTAALLTVLALSLVGCADPPALERTEALAVSCSPLGHYEVLPTPMPYADAATACTDIGGVLVEFESTAEIQAVFDAWVTAQYELETVPPSEALWVGTWINPYEDVEWGYAMMRGGALIPVEQDDAERLGLPACELPL